MNDWKIYTDGSYRSSLKQGGIGIVWIKDDKKVYEFSKGFKDTTNNQMELLAIGYALKSIKNPINSLEIISDSEYALNSIFNKVWKIKKNVVLIDKIKQILINTQKLVASEITWRHTYGHQNDDSEDTKWNNICDKLCSDASKMIL